MNNMQIANACIVYANEMNKFKRLTEGQNYGLTEGGVREEVGYRDAPHLKHFKTVMKLLTLGGLNIVYL